MSTWIWVLLIVAAAGIGAIATMIGIMLYLAKGLNW